MTDFNALGGNPNASLYPQPMQPPPPITNLLANPAQLLGVMGQVIALRQFQARQAAGSAFQNALNTDGSIDMGRLSSGLQNPAASPVAPEAIGDMLAMRGQQISNATNQFALAASQQHAVFDAISSLDRPGVTADDIRNTVVNLTRSTDIPSQIYTGWLAGIDPNNPRASVQNIKNIALGANAARVGTVDQTTGLPKTISSQEATYSNGVPIGLPPGQGENIAANQAAFTQDQANSSDIIANLRPVQQALPLIAKLNHTDFGPGSAEWNQVKGALMTFGVIDANANDTTTMRQEVNKYLRQNAGLAPGANRSDEGSYAAAASNPNLDLTQPANLALLQKQVAFRRMDAALPISFNEQNPSLGARNKYLNYRSGYYQGLDPRAFQLDLMSPDERQQLISSFGKEAFNSDGSLAMKNGKPVSPAAAKFAHSYAIAQQGRFYEGYNPNGQQ